MAVILPQIDAVRHCVIIYSLCCLFILGCDSRLAPPELTVSNDDYLQPTASLTQANLQNALLKAQAARLFAGQLEDLLFLEDILEAVNGRGDEEGLDLIGSGHVDVTHICSGFAELPTADRANGTIEMTLQFTSSIVEAFAWGVARECQYRIDEKNIFFDGEFAVETNDPFLTIWLNARLQFGEDQATDTVSSAALSYHLRLASDTTERLFTVPDGTLVYFLRKDGVEGIRGANDSWRCLFSSGGLCFNSNGDLLEP